MFSGIGGFEYGIERAFYNSTIRKKASGKDNEEAGCSVFKVGYEKGRFGASCVGFSEIDKYATAIYQYHFPEHKAFGDAFNIDPGTIPDFDLLCGGFPCQAFSIAGKRGGFKDTRGTLFFEIARIASAKRPKFLLLENVKGLLSHDHGRTFGTILSALSDLGYFLEWQVLNSKDFGVPQNRERVFIVGHLGGIRGRQVFPIENSDRSFDAPRNERNLSGTISTKNQSGQCQFDGSTTLVGTRRTHKSSKINIVGHSGSGGQKGYIHSTDGIVGDLGASDYKQPKQIVQLNQPTHSNDRVYAEKGLSPALNTMQGGNRQPKIAMPVLTPNRPVKRQNGRRMKNDGDPDFTCTAQDQHGVFDGMRVRRLTPTECERLQAFPDGWTKFGRFGEEVKEISDSQRYKCLGNSVTTTVVAEVVKRIKQS